MVILGGWVFLMGEAPLYIRRVFNALTVSLQCKQLLLRLAHAMR